jgi:hypothetical protein
MKGTRILHRYVTKAGEFRAMGRRYRLRDELEWPKGRKVLISVRPDNPEVAFLYTLEDGRVGAKRLGGMRGFAKVVHEDVS